MHIIDVYLLSCDLSQVFVYVQTPQIVYLKYIQFFVYKLFLNKAVKNVNEKTY